MKIALFLLLTVFSATCSAKLVFEEHLVSVVADPAEDVVAVVFPFTVEGDDEVVVKDFKTPCECLRVSIGEDGRKIWQPGENGYVSGIIEVGTFRGTQKKHIYLSMVGGEAHKLTVAIVIPELLTIEPESLNWEVGAELVEKTIRLTVDEHYSVKIDEIKNSNPNAFEHQVVTIVEWEEYLITIKPLSTATQSLGVLRIATDSKHKRHQSYQAFMKIGKEGKVSKRAR